MHGHYVQICLFHEDNQCDQTNDKEIREHKHFYMQYIIDKGKPHLIVPYFT
jgi:hypothetical protein